MKENPLFWPQVNIKKVDPKWWDEIMASTAYIKFSDELDDSEDFTIRSIVYVIISKSQKEVEEILDGSIQEDRILFIHNLLRSPSELQREKGRKELTGLISDYTEDVLSGR